VLHGNIHRHLLVLSLVNWAIAITCWTISAYLGSAQPTGIFVYSVLFVVGLFAVIVAIGAFVLADFGTEPVQPAAATATAGAGPDAGAPDAGTPDATEAGPHEGAERPADKAVEKPAAKGVETPADKTAGPGA
jgi:hypothetical protein